MDEEVKERFDKIDAALKTLTDMLTDALEQMDSHRKRAKLMKNSVGQQIAMAKKMALDNPMIKNNPQAIKHVEEMFSTIPGGSEE